MLQFLPQDKVVEFARLKPTELLSETEKSLPDRGGSDSLYATHQKLIEQKAFVNDNVKVTVLALKRDHRLGC